MLNGKTQSIRLDDTQGLPPMSLERVTRGVLGVLERTKTSDSRAAVLAPSRPSPTPVATPTRTRARKRRAPTGISSVGALPLPSRRRRFRTLRAPRAFLWKKMCYSLKRPPRHQCLRPPRASSSRGRNGASIEHCMPLSFAGASQMSTTSSGRRTASRCRPKRISTQYAALACPVGLWLQKSLPLARLALPLRVRMGSQSPNGQKPALDTE